MEAPLKKGRYLLPILITAAAITAAGLWFHQNFFRILPLYVSLFVMILSAQVNRYAFLLGGLNSILYAAVYFAYGLYGMAAYALLVSFPIQIVSFLRWKKHAYRSSVELKKLTGKQRVLAAAGFTGIWVLLYLILKQAGAAYVLLDNTVTLFGICISFLQMFAFLEYTQRSGDAGPFYPDASGASGADRLSDLFDLFSDLCDGAACKRKKALPAAAGWNKGGPSCE